MKAIGTTIAILVCCATAAGSLRGQDGPRTGAPAPTSWPAVLDSVVTAIDTLHPDPYRHVGEAAFRARVEALRDVLEHATDEAAAVALMDLVGSLGDGHTLFEPGAEAGFDLWFPVRFYRFEEGVFITVIDSAFGELAGARVISIGSRAAAEAFAAAALLMGADNESGRLETGSVYLSSAPALLGIGAIERLDSLPLEVEDRRGGRRTVVLASRRSSASIGWRFWGEMFGPAPSADDHLGDAYVTAFGVPPRAFRSGGESLPRHLRNRLYYWFDPIPELDALYVQWNFVQDDPDEPLDEFRTRLWAAFDSVGAGSLILDLRYNSGGDGSMLLPFVHDLIRREPLNRPGKIVVLLGRKTFSAAIMLMAELEEHLPVVFVGEPPGAAASHFGDATTVPMPFGSRLRVSTLEWRLGHPADTLPYHPVHVPAPFTAEAYFSGGDPALAAIDAGEARPLEAVLLEDGPQAAFVAYESRAARFGGVSWWAPFDERSMNHLGYELLDEGATDRAIGAFELNARRYPLSRNAWDSLGDALVAGGDVAEARAAYARALMLDPHDDVTRGKLAALPEEP